MPPASTPATDLPQVFADVHSGRCELGVVPLENSLQGTVGVSFDLFLKYDVHIQAELFSPISHCLLSHAASLAEITTVYSHPQPLAQCGGWLRSHLPQAGLIPVESTAAAARMAAANPQSAAIGNGKLADMAGLARPAMSASLPLPMAADCGLAAAMRAAAAVDSTGMRPAWGRWLRSQPPHWARGWGCE